MPVNATMFDELPLAEQVACYVAYAMYDPARVYFRFVSASTLPLTILLALAVACVVIGSFATVAMPQNALDPNEDAENPKWDPSDRDHSTYLRSTILDLEVLQMDRISLKYTVLVPVLAASVLCTIYYVIQHYLLAVILRYLQYYVGVVSVPATYLTFDYLTVALRRKLLYYTGRDLSSTSRFRLTISQDPKHHTYPLGPLELTTIEGNPIFLLSTTKERSDLKTLKRHYRQHGIRFLPLSHIDSANQKYNYVFDYANISSAIASVTVCGLIYKYSTPSNWILSNVLGVNFAIFGIQNLRLSNFKIAVLLLVGLFIYDIYFVFKTDIMVTVANGLEAPIKLAVPRQPDYFRNNRHGFESSLWALLDLVSNTSASSLAKLPTVMLGLGDIVVPGSYVALCLRFDLYKHHQGPKRFAFHHLNPYSKVYFWTSLFGYALGLVITVVVLQWFGTGQPALLYIVPCVLSSVLVMGAIRGDIIQLWSYTEEIPGVPAARDSEEAEDVQVPAFAAFEYSDDEKDISFDADDIDSDEDIDMISENLDLSHDDETDLDAFVNTRIYLMQSDSDDDTFLIESESELDEEIDSFSNDVYLVSQTEIAILHRDKKNEPRVWYED